MIRLRKHDRKMLKISAVLASAILVLLGLVWLDMQRNFRADGSPLPGTRAINRSSLHSGFDRGDESGVGTLSAANIHVGSDPLFYPEGMNGSGANLAAFESNGESTSSVPEPSTLAIAALGGAVLLLNRRRAARLLTK